MHRHAYNHTYNPSLHPSIHTYINAVICTYRDKPTCVAYVIIMVCTPLRKFVEILYNVSIHNFLLRENVCNNEKTAVK